MEITVQVGVIAALVLALASIGGGVVLFRGSRRVGWRALGMSAVVGGVGVLMVFALLFTASSDGQALEPIIVGKAVPTQPTAVPPPSQGPRTPTSSSGMMLPRPNSVLELVAGAQAIVVGTIDSVIEEKRIGPYGEDGQPLPAGEEGGIPVTDYQLQIEDGLMGYSTDADGDSLVLRLFGHLSNANAVITPNVFTLPNPGDRLLFALGRNPDGTYGSGPEGLLRVDGEKVEHIDGVPFAVDVSPEQFLLDIVATIRPPCCKP